MDTKPDFREYGHAPLEGSEKLVTVYRHRRGRHFIFEPVPARVCPRCGERDFSACVVCEMDRPMQSRKRTILTVPVSVIACKTVGP
jgi:YgiT-type zinc finger domain-containing protein